ncbi:PhoX family phosphatase [Stella sp.]|uniref:PhoX family protein n=1 Tax=Stella sp. TaxID=2912054 RepID=UPI0035B3D030
MQDAESVEWPHGDDPRSNRSAAPPIAAIISRRALLAGLAAATLAPLARPARAADGVFAPVPAGVDDRDHLPVGHSRQVLLRWGDPLFADAPAFSVAGQSAAAQARQFGYNCDFVCYFPLPAGSRSSDHGLLVVNHEYAIPALMFPGVAPGREATQTLGPAEAAVEMASLGASVVEVRRGPGGWTVVPGAHTRRITATTPMVLGGPAAGHPRMRTTADPAGRTVAGTFANCAGGETPWGTVLSGEENVHAFFGGAAGDDPARARYGIDGRGWYSWHRHDPRFDLAREPNEPNRFGWIVEFDPYDPRSVPVKRTALGRFKHEGATCVVNPDGRIAVYQGDDERFEYVYKFVTTRAWVPGDPAANRDLLDDGILYVARFHADGRLEWLPLVHGQGPLTAENGFPDQATVVIEARRAADRVGATPMDRPEDVEASPKTGRVYVTMTNNHRREAARIDAANPRAENRHGHVIEMVPPAGPGGPDHAATEASWELFLAAGRPGTDPGTVYGAGSGPEDWLSCPDNLVFDAAGRLWIATDSGLAAGAADGLYLATTEGPERGRVRRLYRAPIGAEVTGPAFTPDGRTLFLSVQHPGASRGSHFARPSTRWPDFAEGVPPRPSVVAITRDDGGPVGG